VLTQFGQILVFLLLAVIFVFIGLLVSRIISPHNPTKEKRITYECGEDVLGPSWVKFNIRFYVIALIFVVFDIEVVFLFPWAVVFQNMGMFAFIEMLVFLVILAVGFVFVWARGDLEWVRPKPEIPVLNRNILKSEQITEKASDLQPAESTKQ
jgi:NADH-quinone oxidoreductase subunit A